MLSKLTSSVLSIQHVPMLICPTLAVNKELKIAVEPLLIEGQNGLKTIDPPFYQSKAKIINARLLSYSQREGQVDVIIVFVSQRCVFYILLSI